MAHLGDAEFVQVQFRVLSTTQQRWTILRQCVTYLQPRAPQGNCQNPVGHKEGLGKIWLELSQQE